MLRTGHLSKEKLLTELKIISISSGLLCSLLCYLLFNNAIAQTRNMPDKEQPLAKQAWGTVLYEFYQQNYQQGLVKLAVAEHQGIGQHQGLAQYQAQALVAKGGMSLALGLAEQADNIFNQLASTQDPEVQAKAWFWLTKSYFESGQWPEAQQALHKTNAWHDDYDNKHLEQLGYMQGQILLVPMVDPVQDPSGNVASSTQANISPEQFNNVIANLAKGSVYLAYLHYNYGVYLLESGQLNSAIHAFNQAKSAVLENKQARWQDSWLTRWTKNTWLNNYWAKPEQKITPLEYQGLLDRIHLALGYTYLADKQTQAALNQFANIHHQQQDAANALLGYAQALSSQGDMPLALAIWHKISTDYPSSIAALQALLAMAWQLEQGGDEQQAWDILEVSLGQISQANQAVEQSLLHIQQADFLAQMTAHTTSNNAQEQTLAWPASQADILQSLLAGQSREQLNSWLDLEQQQAQLALKHQDIIGFKQLLDERKQTAVSRGAQVAQSDIHQLSENLASRLALLKSKVQLAEENQDASVFANQSQLEQLNRLSRAKAKLQKILGAKTISPKYAQRLARVEGILKWQFADNYQPLLWQHQQQIKQTEALLQQAKRSTQSIQSRIATPPTYADEYAKIENLEQGIQGFKQQITHLQSQISQQLTSKASAALSARVDYLQQVEQNVRLAMLRLQDKDPLSLLNSQTDRQEASDE